MLSSGFVVLILGISLGSSLFFVVVLQFKNPAKIKEKRHRWKNVSHNVKTPNPSISPSVKKKSRKRKRKKRSASEVLTQTPPPPKAFEVTSPPKTKEVVEPVPPVPSVEEKNEVAERQEEEKLEAADAETKEAEEEVIEPKIEEVEKIRKEIDLSSVPPIELPSEDGGDSEFDFLTEALPETMEAEVKSIQSEPVIQSARKPPLVYRGGNALYKEQQEAMLDTTEKQSRERSMTPNRIISDTTTCKSSVYEQESPPSSGSDSAKTTDSYGESVETGASSQSTSQNQTGDEETEPEPAEEERRFSPQTQTHQMKRSQSTRSVNSNPIHHYHSNSNRHRSAHSPHSSTYSPNRGARNKRYNGTKRKKQPRFGKQHRSNSMPFMNQGRHDFHQEAAVAAFQQNPHHPAFHQPHPHHLAQATQGPPLQLPNAFHPHASPRPQHAPPLNFGQPMQPTLQQVQPFFAQQMQQFQKFQQLQEMTAAVEQNNLHPLQAAKSECPILPQQFVNANHPQHMPVQILPENFPQPTMGQNMVPVVHPHGPQLIYQLNQMPHHTAVSPQVVSPQPQLFYHHGMNAQMPNFIPVGQMPTT